jgi:DNA-directed RNA polymerase omega subunit
MMSKATEANDPESQPAQENQTPEMDSKYRMIIVAAQRSKQLQRGARPRIEGMDTQRHKPTRVALEEVQQGKITFNLTDTTT